MGWEHTGSELRGHFLGHWLSAASMSYAAGGLRDAALAESIATVIAALQEVVRRDGYLVRLQRDPNPPIRLEPPMHSSFQAVVEGIKSCPGSLLSLTASSTASKA